MIRLKRMLNNVNAKNKSLLSSIYASKDEMEQTYEYEELKFYFVCPSFREIERNLIYIIIPCDYFPKCNSELIVALEDFILRTISPKINELSGSYRNIKKDQLQKASLCAQICNEVITKRNGLIYNDKKQAFILRVGCTMPLVNNTWINSKGILRMLRELLKLISDCLKEFNVELCEEQLNCYNKQQQIRSYLNKNNGVAFIGDGSVIPRESGSSNPMKNAIPFKSPESLRKTINFLDGTSISGMLIPEGVTVITGGGYSGKSTLLDAIEVGIYNHVPLDGREFVITNETALKIYAEDGRPVENIDMSPFFKFFPGDHDINSFSTFYASGSVSQAANIIEAVCLESKVLLIDEDKSATNFMIRDKNMRKIIKKEPIIPFTDRVRQLYFDKGVSTILVIGGSSEYLAYADTVLLMDDYIAKDITKEIYNEFNIVAEVNTEKTINWMEHRYLVPKETSDPFLYFKSVSTENLKQIVLDEYSADITLLTALISENQLNFLTYVMNRLLTNKESNILELNRSVKEICNIIYSEKFNEIMISSSFKSDSWFEAVRVIDICCCANRMRGLKFKNTLGGKDAEN